MEYENYFVAFIDILGFKRIIDNSSCEEVLNIFSNFKMQIIDIKLGKDSLVNTEDIKFKTMSDSIVFYIKDDSKNALFALLTTCALFQTKLITMKKPILSRGGIAHGQFYIDGDIMFGKALTSAYLLESQNAKYPRIIMCNSLIKEYGNDLCYRLLFEDNDCFQTIDFIGSLLSGYNTGLKDFLKFQKHIIGVLDSTTDNAVREKYIYLKDKLNLIHKHFKEVNPNV